MHRRGHVLPVVAQRRVDLLGGGEDQRRGVVDQVERGAERIHREEITDRRRAPLRVRRRRALLQLVRLGKRQLGHLAVLERELGGRVELDPLGLAERPLGEGREVADRLDLVAEQLEPRGPLLGGGEHVEDPAANRELAPFLHLLDPLVTRLDQELGDVAEVDLLAAMKGEARRPQGGVGNRLGERDRGGDDHGRLVTLLGQSVEGCDPQSDEVRRRGEVGRVAGAARGVVADPARLQVGAERPGEVAGADVVGGDHERRAAA